MKVHKDIVYGLQLWVRENIGMKLRIQDIANKSGYSRYYIQHLFKQITGVTLATYIRDEKLACAKDALKNSDVEIVDVALSYGLNCQQGFTRAFKHKYGVSPCKYRLQQTLKK